MPIFAVPTLYTHYGFFAVLAFPPIIYVAASNEPALRWHSACLWVGAISYALYITHWPLMHLTRAKSLFGMNPPWAGNALAMVAVLLAAILTRVDPVLRSALSRIGALRQEKAQFTQSAQKPLLPAQG